jgi:hypothetical protein
MSVRIVSLPIISYAQIVPEKGFFPKWSYTYSFHPEIRPADGGRVNGIR